MLNITINGKKVSTSAATILEVARELKISIPTLCHLDGCERFTSCMVCLVKDVAREKLIPACSSPVIEGLEIETDSDEVKEARREALELLLSEHLGDCEAICRVACPAYVNVPEVIRKIKEDDITTAAQVLQAGIALPRIIGRICHAPCQKACKRGRHDEPVLIRQLERYVADKNFAKGNDLKPEKSSGKKVGIIGSGPTGLSSAFHLSILGHQCVIFEKNKEFGGNLRSQIPEEDLPQKVLDEEIDVIRKLGCEFRNNTEIDKTAFSKICDEYDAVVVAIGAQFADFSLETSEIGLEIEYETFQTSKQGVFAGGDVLMPLKQVIRSVADGRSIAISIDSLLKHGKLQAPAKEFDSRSAKNTKEVIADDVANANSDKAVEIENPKDGFSPEEALAEAKRCLDCDCAKATSCKLRDFATEYGAAQSRYKVSKGEIDPLLYKKSIAGNLVFDPGKCIKCGLCVRISAKYNDEPGLAFHGRGFSTRITVPFDDPLSEGVKDSAEECVKGCPTAALAWK